MLKSDLVVEFDELKFGEQFCGIKVRIDFILDDKADFGGVYGVIQGLGLKGG